MSKISNAMLTVEDLFMEAKKDYEFWRDEMIKHGYNEDDAIAAAQHYGRMIGYASVNKELLGDEGLHEIISQMFENRESKLFRSDFEKS